MSSPGPIPSMASSGGAAISSWWPSCSPRRVSWSGFFLPGDSLLITAGLVAATGTLNIWWLNMLLIAAAVIGDSVGYAIGARLGPALFTREKSLLFNPRHVERTREFYARYGARTIVIARFVPIIRTFAPVVAGVGRMEYRRFLLFNVAGGVGWVMSMTWAGYLLGRPDPRRRPVHPHHRDRGDRAVLPSDPVRAAARPGPLLGLINRRAGPGIRRADGRMKRRSLMRGALGSVALLMLGAGRWGAGLAAGQESLRPGAVNGTALGSGPRPTSPPAPLTGLGLLLLPRSDSLLADLERVRKHSRDSLDADRSALPELGRILDGAASGLRAEGRGRKVRSATLDPAGHFALPEVPPGNWILVAYRSVHVDRSGHDAAPESGTFLPRPRLVGYDRVSLWLQTLTIEPGRAATVELTDRNVWFEGVAEQTSARERLPSTNRRRSSR